MSVDAKQQTLDGAVIPSHLVKDTQGLGIEQGTKKIHGREVDLGINAQCEWGCEVCCNKVTRTPEGREYGHKLDCEHWDGQGGGQ